MQEAYIDPLGENKKGLNGVTADVVSKTYAPLASVKKVNY